MPLSSTSIHGHKIFFPTATDTLSQNLTDITWGPSSISIPSTSPLNLPAQISLQTTTQNLPSIHRWCLNNNATFLSLWTENNLPKGFIFSVSHFSRYRYEESSSDSDDPTPHHPPPIPPTANPSKQPPQQIPPHYPRPRLSTPLKLLPPSPPPSPDPTMHTPSSIPPPTSPTPDPLPNYNPPLPEHPAMHQLRAALFEDYIIPPPDHDMPDLSPIPHPTNQPFPDSIHHDPESPSNREAGPFGLDDPARRPAPVPDALFPDSVLPFPVFKDSVIANKEGLFCDTGLMLGRAKRVAFAHDGSLLRPTWNIGDGRFGARGGFCVELDQVYAGPELQSREVLAPLLRVHCAVWFAALGEGDCGDGVRVPRLAAAFGKHARVAEGTMRECVDVVGECAEMGDANAVHAQVAFWMLLALYREEEGATVFGGGDMLLRRVAEWATGPAGLAFEDAGNSDSDGLRGALLCLTVGKVDDAVQKAIGVGKLRLALLIARALEAPKERLREDARAQLRVYGVWRDDEEGDQILEGCSDNASVSVDERMILLVLAGDVAPVVRYLKLSWYRLFIMELLYGKGSSDLTQAERVSAAVDAVGRSGVSTVAPHGTSEDLDVVYHLLRLYADPTASYSLTAGVYSPSSFGSRYCPLDARFSWLMYELLTAVVPEAVAENAPQMLADSFSTQLRAAGLHLWSFYVLCSGGSPPHVIKDALIRDWPNMAEDYVEWGKEDGEGGAENLSTEMRDNDTEMGGCASSDGRDARKSQMGAEAFTIDVLRIPPEWVSEAKALAARSVGDKLEECQHWIASETDHGAFRAHELLSTEVFPEMVAVQDVSQYTVVADLLRKLDSSSKHVSSWSTSGGLILDYLDFVVGVPDVKKQPLDVYRNMVHRVKAMKSRAETPEQHHAASVIADGIAVVERTHLFHASPEERNVLLERLVDDLAQLPCTTASALRTAGEYKNEAEYGRDVALRFSAAYPPYARYLAPSNPAHG